MFEMIKCHQRKEVCHLDTVKCEVFLATVDRGSFTAAGEAFGYTQSGVTRMINSLEEELGFPLFVRSKRGVALTGNGNLMLPIFRELVRASRRIEQLSRDINGIEVGTLTIGVYRSVSAMLMPAIIKRFQTRYPHITIDLLKGGNQEMIKWLNERSVDCCFCGELFKQVWCDWIPLLQDEMVALLPGTHPYADRPSYPLADLEKDPVILTYPNHDTDQDRLLTNAGLTPHVCFTTDDCYSTYKMVEAGLGVSFEQRMMSREWHGAVYEVPFDPPQYISLGIAVPSMQEASLATRKFIECAQDILRTSGNAAPQRA